MLGRFLHFRIWDPNCGVGKAGLNRGGYKAHLFPGLFRTLLEFTAYPAFYRILSVFKAARKVIWDLLSCDFSWGYEKRHSFTLERILADQWILFGVNLVNHWIYWVQKGAAMWISCEGLVVFLKASNSGDFIITAFCFLLIYLPRLCSGWSLGDHINAASW